MSNHLKSKHPQESRLISTSKTSEISRSITVSQRANPSPIAPSTTAEKQLTLSESFERKLLWDVNDAKAKKYHYLIAEMIAIDNEPFSIVEKVGFKRLLEQALPRYELPSRTYISQKIIPDIYNRIRDKIKANISKAIAISATSDIWTCLHNSSSFLSFTAHWLSPEFQLNHGVLAMKPFSGSHTGENIANELNAIAARWDIEKDKIHLLIHDSGANMVKGARVGEYHSARCFIHSLQRVIDKSMKVQAELLEVIATGRRLVTHFNHSGLAQEKLLAIQKELNLPQHQLVQDINTRWNSTYYMAARLVEQKRAISLYVVEHETLTNLTIQQWGLLEQCINLLKPFEEITKITSSGVSCISEVIPHVYALKKYLDKTETAQRTPDLARLRASLKAELESRFKSLEEDLNFIIATFLDPRFKSDYLGVLETEKARQKILIEYIKNSYDDSSSDSNRSSPSSTPAKRQKEDETGSNFTREAHNTFWDCFNEVAKDNSSSCRDQEKQNPISNEIDFFLKLSRIDRNRDPYLWWSVNSNQYPQLAKFARIYLGAPASSVYSERLFSEAGLVYEAKRSRLLPTNAENLVFIHHNLPLVNFEY